MKLEVFLGILAVVFLVDSVAAQHPIDVQSTAARGDYYQAFLTYKKMPRRVMTTAATLAAARSAWALSLPDEAVAKFEQVLKDQSLDDVSRARVLLSRAIIEYQEERYQLAAIYAERMVQLLKDTPGPLRAQGWLVWAEALSRIGSLAAAETRFESAISEAAPKEIPEIAFLLGRCRFNLGKYQEAQDSFERVPVDHIRTPEALRFLAKISLQRGELEPAAFWLARGRDDHPDHFLDSWVDYVLLKAAISEGDLEKAKKLSETAFSNFPPSDSWLTLMQAAFEHFQWQKTGLALRE